jgi:uncharacterized membrane protein YdfJ with MMPL/SSD domain
LTGAVQFDAAPVIASMQQLGIGLAVAIFLDATIVRGLLLPSVMSLLGERNRYLPRSLDRLIPGRAIASDVAEPAGVSAMRKAA